jgi:hypothetical protein
MDEDAHGTAGRQENRRARLPGVAVEDPRSLWAAGSPPLTDSGHREGIQRAKTPPYCPRTLPQVFAPCLLSPEKASAAKSSCQLQPITNK